MSVARLRIVAAGPLTSIQDAGRPGWRRFGVPPSGPVDRRAFAAAHAALGNPPGGAVIEGSLGGLSIACEQGRVAVAVTGAFVGTTNDVPLGGWTTLVLRAGMTLRLGEGEGNWGYVAFAGRLVAREWLGSAATHLIAGLGGGALAAGDELTVEAARDDLRTGAIARPPGDTPIETVRFVPGPQERHFDAATLAQLRAAPFAASARFDRMGMVLDGPALKPAAIDMPSEPAVRGALQVDGDGRVSLLTADHQTTGGYPRIGVAISADADRAAQLPAGAPLRFAPVTPEAAVAAARETAARDAAWLADVAAGVRPLPSLLETNLIDGVVRVGE